MDARSQVKHINNNPHSIKKKVFSPFDIQSLIEEDRLNSGTDKPFRFGKGFDVDLTLDDGKWTKVNGGKLWLKGFKSEGATISFDANLYEGILEVEDIVSFRIIHYQEWVGTATADCLWLQFTASIEFCSN